MTLFSISASSQIYVLAGLDIRNAIVGSEPTNNKSEINFMLQFGMIGGNTEVSVGYERFEAICFDKMFFSVGHHFPLYGNLFGKEVKTILIPSIEPSLIGRWGSEWETKSSHLTIGASLALRYEISHKISIELQCNALPRVDLFARYPEAHSGMPFVFSNYFKILYRL